MSTVVDDLLLDFADSGDDAEDDQENGTGQENAVAAADGDGDEIRETMDMDDEDEARDEQSDDEMNDPDVADVTKARIEKMELATVESVHGIASLMKVLEPILEVSSPPFLLSIYLSLVSQSFTSHCMEN